MADASPPDGQILAGADFEVDRNISDARGNNLNP
jgi:hypothetical protein